MVMLSEGLLILVFLVLIGVNAFVLGRRGSHRRDEPVVSEQDEVERLVGLVAESQAENQKLRERLEVLERLATDGDAQLAREINKLKREKRKPDEDENRPSA